MRFVMALVAFVVAAALMGLGIAQRTLLLPSDSRSSSVSLPADVHYAVISGAALGSEPGQQRLRLAGDGVVFAAYGRTADVLAWLGGEQYARVGVDSQTGSLTTPKVQTAPAVAGVTSTTGTSPDPSGSDLWYDQRRAEHAIDWTIDVPSNVSVIIASNGAAALPKTFTVTWPVRADTPFAVPLIVSGGALLVVGLILYVWALIHMRRRRGPRRKPPPKMPKPPTPAKLKSRSVLEPSSGRGRRAVRRTAVPVVGVVLIGGMLAGCQSTATPSATASTTATAPAVTPAVVTTAQAERIVRDAARVAQRADSALDGQALAARFTGPALALRQAAYKVAKVDKQSASLPQALPTTNLALRVVLPEATRGWPRSLFAVVADSSNAKVAPIALTLLQQTPRSQYQVAYASVLQPNSSLPALPVPTTGAARLQPNTTLLKMPPADIAGQYGLLLRKSDASAAAQFDLTNDDLIAAVGPAAKAKIAKSLGSTATLTVADAPTDPTGIVALATADSGAIVSLTLRETWTVKPAKSGVSVKPSGATKALLGKSSTTKGIVSTYDYQLLFSVPAASSTGRVVLLGYAQGLTAAKEFSK